MKSLFTFLMRRQTSLRSATVILMAMVASSRVLGLVRDRLLATYFSPDSLGVYIAAFRLPNMLFEILVMGAMTAAFIPVFTKSLVEDKESGAWHMASTLINITVLFMGLLSIPMLIWTEQMSSVLAPGFTPEQTRLMAEFTRFMIVFQVFPFMVGNFFTGILQSFNLFFIPAFAPVVYNIGIIGGIVILSPTMGLWAPVIGVGIGALLFTLIQIPMLWKLGYRYRPVVDMKNSRVREVGKLMGPRTFGLAVSQIDSTVDLALSSLLGAASVTYFSFAQHLQQLPIGLFGATVAQAAFPILSQSIARDEKDKFTDTLVSGISYTAFCILPISVLFIILRIPIVRLVFGASHYDWESTVLTGITLSMFSVSLTAQAVSQLLTRAFYALYDSKTPVIISIINIVMNSILSVIFIMVLKLPVWSLGLSTSIANIVNVILLFVLLVRKAPYLPSWPILRRLSKMLLATTVMGLALYIPLKLFDQLVFDTQRTVGLLMLTGISGSIGLLCYLFLSWVLDVQEGKQFILMLGKVRRVKMPVMEPVNEVVTSGGQDTPIPS